MPEMSKREITKLVVAHAMLSNTDFMKSINARVKYAATDTEQQKALKLQKEFKLRVEEYATLLETDV